jgi:hypothetical protein
VQDCPARNFEVQLDLTAQFRSANPEQMLDTVNSFAVWLVKHGGLVKSLAMTPLSHPVSYLFVPPVPHLRLQSIMQTAVQVLSTAVRLAAAAQVVHPSTAAAAAAAEAAGAQQQQQQQPLLPLQPGLRLANFRSDSVVAVGLLPVVSAQTLTTLEVDPCWRNSSPEYWVAVPEDALARALQHLSSLQQLALHFEDGTKGELSSCMQVLGRLRMLTRLKLDVDWEGDAMHALQQLVAQPPPLLRALQLVTANPDDEDWQPSLDMSCLTQLHEFACDALMFVDVLPAQLKHLDVGTSCVCNRSASLMPLQQLTALHGYVHSRHPEQLLRLTQLPALQELHLKYQNCNCAAATAPAWQRLPVCKLRLDDIGVDDYVGDDLTLLAGLAATTTLTSLTFSQWCDIEDAGDGQQQQHVQLNALAAIAKLTGLRRLDLCNLDCKGDALALTALTGLTYLGLHSCGTWLTDTKVTALACCLKQLRHLDVSDCDLGAMACIGAIAHLPALTCLRFARVSRLGCKGLTRENLLMLTRLSYMQCLEVDRSAEVTDEVVDSLWAQLHNSGDGRH